MALNLPACLRFPTRKMGSAKCVVVRIYPNLPEFTRISLWFGAEFPLLCCYACAKMKWFFVAVWCIINISGAVGAWTCVRSCAQDVVDEHGERWVMDLKEQIGFLICQHMDTHTRIDKPAEAGNSEEER